MYCSTCGADNQSENSYCKRCGEWLPYLTGRSRVAFGGETPQQNILTGLFMSALSTLAALFSAIALYATYLGGGEAKWSIYVAAAFCVCIAGWQASSFFVTMKLRRRLKRGREESASAAELGPRQTSPALPEANRGSFIETPSVTENTTQILKSRSGAEDRET